MSIGASCNCDKRQQATTKLPIAMGTIIAMDTINAFIVRCQSAHKRSLSNATRKAVAINLEATWRPHQQMQQGHREGILSVTTILILQQRLLLQGRQSLQSMRNEHKLRRFANRRRSQGSFEMTATIVTVSMTNASSTSVKRTQWDKMLL